MSALSALGGYGSSSDDEEESKQEPKPTPPPPVQPTPDPTPTPTPTPTSTPTPSNPNPSQPSSTLFGSLPEAEGHSNLRAKPKRKKHKRKKHKSKSKSRSRATIDDDTFIPILSIGKEKIIEKQVHERRTAAQSRLQAQQKLLNSDAPQIGPTMPQQSPSHARQPPFMLQPANPNPHPNPDSKSSLWEHNLDPRHMERDVRNFVESGGDLSKFSEHNAFATVDGTKVAAATKAMANPDSAGEKLSVGYLPTNNYKRRHNISGLVNDAENFETELEERRSKAARGKKSVRSMYGF